MGPSTPLRDCAPQSPSLQLGFRVTAGPLHTAPAGPRSCLGAQGQTLVWRSHDTPGVRCLSLCNSCPNPTYLKPRCTLLPQEDPGPTPAPGHLPLLVCQHVTAGARGGPSESAGEDPGPPPAPCVARPQAPELHGPSLNLNLTANLPSGPGQVAWLRARMPHLSRHRELLRHCADTQAFCGTRRARLGTGVHRRPHGAPSSCPHGGHG